MLFRWLKKSSISRLQQFLSNQFWFRRVQEKAQGIWTPGESAHCSKIMSKYPAWVTPHAGHNRWYSYSVGFCGLRHMHLSRSEFVLGFLTVQRRASNGQKGSLNKTPPSLVRSWNQFEHFYIDTPRSCTERMVSLSAPRQCAERRRMIEPFQSVWRECHVRNTCRLYSKLPEEVFH